MMKITTYAFVGVWLVILGCVLWPRASASNQIITRWFETQQIGHPGEECWAPGTEPITLYAVRSWEVLIATSDTYVVRVESSTREGIPIIRLWRVRLEGDKIQSVEPAQD